MRITIEALTGQEIEKVHQITLDVMASKGLSFMSDEALLTFKNNGFKVDGQRVYFTQAQIETALKSAPEKFEIYGRNPDRSLTIGQGQPPVYLSSSGVPKIITKEGQQRMLNFDDYRQMLKLTQTSPILKMANSGALYPSHEDPELALYLQVYYTLLMTDLPLVGQTEGRLLSQYSIDMARAATGLQDQTIMVGICNSLSPMAWDNRMLEGLEVFARSGQAVNISCCAMCGATAPIYIIGAIVQANCEVLGGLVYSQLIKAGTPVIYGTTSSVMDMGSMGLSLGAPEYTLISMGCSQMASHYGLPFRGGGGLTDAKDLDAQAGLESAWNLIFSSFGRVHFMLQSVGIMESFMAVAFDKWVLDEEIISRIARLARGIGPIPEDLTEIFSQGIEAGSYLKLKSTVKNFRKELYRPLLGDRLSFESFKQKGLSLKGEAWRLVEKRLNDYQSPAMEPEALKAMQSIFEKSTGQKSPEI